LLLDAPYNRDFRQNFALLSALLALPALLALLPFSVSPKFRSIIDLRLPTPGGTNFGTKKGPKIEGLKLFRMKLQKTPFLAKFLEN
jgi:hypothetical protein